MLARHRKWASCAAVAAGVASTWLTGSCARPAASCANRTSTTESDHEPAPRYSDDAQAGGHVDGVRFMGAMLHKRLQDEGRGDREVAALAALAQSPRWRDYVPRYGGLRTEPAGSESWLVMENLAAGMVRPAVMDIKIGTRHFSSDAPPKKIAKEKKKANTTTIGTHGLRIVGCRVPAMPPPTTNGGKWAETWGYKLGNDANATALPGVIQRFLGTRQRAEDAKTFVQELREVFATQREYVFYSSSLLLVYDASLGDAAQLRIKMIDFGHVHPWEPSDDPRYPEGGNDGYLFGIDMLIGILEATEEGIAAAADSGESGVRWGASGRWGGPAQ